MKTGNTTRKILIIISFFLPSAFYIGAELSRALLDERLVTLFFIILWVLSCAWILFFLSDKIFKSKLAKVWRVLLFILLLLGFLPFILLSGLPGYYLFHACR